MDIVKEALSGSLNHNLPPLHCHLSSCGDKESHDLWDKNGEFFSFLLIPSPFAISNLLQKNLYHVSKDSMDEEREKGRRGMRGGIEE